MREKSLGTVLATEKEPETHIKKSRDLKALINISLLVGHLILGILMIVL